MNGLLLWLLETSVSTALLALLAMIVCRFFARRPAIQHLVWLAVLLKFVLPPVIAWPGSAQLVVRHWIEGLTARPVPSRGLSAEAMSMTSVDVGIEAAATPMETPAVSVVWMTLSFPQIAIVTLWGAGLIWILYCQLRRIRKCQSILSQTFIAPRYLVDEVSALSNEFGMRSVPVQVVDQITSPFVWCFGWLRLVWPQSLASEADVHRSRSILAHELGHVCRGDHWVAWIELAASLIWWWNPVFWFVRHRLRESAEMSCDAMALSALPDERLAYAELFLQLSSSSKPGVPVPVLGVSTGTPSSFERRLTMILSEGVSGKLSPVGICAAAALLGFGMPSLLQGEQKEFENTERNTGNVIYLVDDDGDGVADRPATSVDSEFIDGDPSLGKIYFIADTDAEGRKVRRKVTIVNSKPIENGIVIHTLGRLKPKAAGGHKVPPWSDIPENTQLLLDPSIEQPAEKKNIEAERKMRELRNQLDALVQQHHAEAALREANRAWKEKQLHDETLWREKLNRDAKLSAEGRVKSLQVEVERLKAALDKVKAEQIHAIEAHRKSVKSLKGDIHDDKRDQLGLEGLELEAEMLLEYTKAREPKPKKGALKLDSKATFSEGILDQEVPSKLDPAPKAVRAPKKEDVKATGTLDELGVESPDEVKPGKKPVPGETGTLKQFLKSNAKVKEQLDATTHPKPKTTSKVDMVLKVIASDDSKDDDRRLAAIEADGGRVLWTVNLPDGATQIKSFTKHNSTLNVLFNNGYRISVDSKTGKVTASADATTRQEVEELELELRKLREQLGPPLPKRPVELQPEQ